VNPETLELLELPEWAKLLRHFELGEGFAYIILLVSNRAVARRCQSELDLWLRTRHRPSLFVVPLKTPDDVSSIPEQLLALTPPDGPIWVDGTGTRQVYEQAWNRCAMKLNRARDTISARFSEPLIIVGAPYIREILRDAAPDFWSVRAFVAEISVPTRVPLPDRPTSGENASEFSLDPDLALRDIAALRRKPGRERLLSKLLHRAGTELLRRGRFQEALPLLREATELDEAAVNANPNRADYLRGLSIAYATMGDLRCSLGEGEAARQLYEKSLRIAERLVAQEPGRADYLRDLAVSYGKLGNLQITLGDTEAAKQFCQKSLNIRERLVAREPGRGEYLRDLSVAYTKMGDSYLAVGEADAAHQFYEKSLRIGERLAAEEPDRADYLRDLSASYFKLGDLQHALDEEQAARQLYEKSLRIGERLVAAQPQRADYLLDLVKSLMRIGGEHHLQRALNILLDLQHTNRLNKSEENLITFLQKKLSPAPSIT